MADIPKLLGKSRRRKLTLSIDAEIKEKLFELKRLHSTSATRIVEFLVCEMYSKEKRLEK